VASHRTIRFRARWPVAWRSTAAGPELAVVSPSGDGVWVVALPRGRPRTFLSPSILRSVAGGAALGPIVLLAWSPYGLTLGVGFISDPLGPGEGGVARVDALSRRGTFGGAGRQPIALSWSRHGDLVVQFEDRDPVTGLLRAGETSLETLPIADATWSPDGRWILGRGLEGWTGVRAADLADSFGFGEASRRWFRARWCCPPVRVAYLAGQSPSGF
jgi:hypothetical protein